MPGDELDDALISRSLFVDVNPDINQVLDRINSIKPNIQPNIPIDTKNQVVEFMVLLNEKYEIRFPINLRTFVHCLNVRIANDFKMKFGEQEIPAWQMLIKQYLIKK